MREESIDEVVERMMAGHDQSRRQFLQRLGVMGAATSGVGTLVAGCGGVKGTSGQGAKQDEKAASISHPKTTIGNWTWSNWPLYMDKKLLKQFDKQQGGHVKYIEDINDNAEFTSKVQAQLNGGTPIGRDLVVITDTTAAKWIRNGWAEPVDWKNVPNRKNVLPAWSKYDYDPDGRYLLPYQSGGIGIGYNPKLTGREITSFNDLFDPAFKGRVGMFSNNQDVGNLALVGMGIKTEKSTPADWQKAADKLKQQRDAGIVRKYYDQSYIQALSKGDTWISMAWSGDVFQANLSAGNNDLKFIVPKEGAIIWTDNMCIPVGAAHPVDAITYMDYVYQPAVAAMLAESIEYITPVPGAKDVIVQDANAATDADTKQGLLDTANSPLVFPSPADLAKTSYYRVLNPSEAAQWNDIFNAVIIT
jgi:spermidine/putrescine transport system substrate-binding protein